jgi:hypothetical protein
MDNIPVCQISTTGEHGKYICDTGKVLSNWTYLVSLKKYMFKLCMHNSQMHEYQAQSLSIQAKYVVNFHIRPVF